MVDNLVTPNKRPRRASRPTSSAERKNKKLLTPTSEGSPQRWIKTHESTPSSSESWKCLLMGPPPSSSSSSSSGTNSSSSKTIIKQSPPPSETSPLPFLLTGRPPPSVVGETDVSPESLLLPVFKRVTRYVKGDRKVCFVNFDRFPRLSLFNRTKLLGEVSPGADWSMSGLEEGVEDGAGEGEGAEEEDEEEDGEEDGEEDEGEGEGEGEEVSSSDNETAQSFPRPQIGFTTGFH